MSAVVYKVSGGPLDGETVTLPDDVVTLEVDELDDDLEQLLRLSVDVAQGKLVALPTKTAIYRVVRLKTRGNVVPIERTLRFEGWKEG